MTTRTIQRKVAFCQGGCFAVMAATTRPTVTCLRCVNEKRRVAGRKSPSQKITKCHAGCGRSLPYQRNAKLVCETCKPHRKKEKDCRAAAVQRSKRGGYTADVAAYAANWARLKREADPSWVMARRITAMMNRCLSSGKEGKSWRDLVPYTLPDLMQHLERQFTKGMTWENRREWHIDHIIPLSSFSFTTPNCPEFQAAWCLSNLRPLWAIDNMRKSATRTHLI